MRAVPDSLDPSVVAQVDARLDAVEREHGVRVAWGIESGSRAWGFPSPDSDYDARFLYVRPLDDYLSPWRPRDVVETPLDAVLDVNGWDLVKAVDLLVRGNATVPEWLASPIVYRGDERFRDALRALASQVVLRDAVGRHYTHLGRLQWDRHGVGRSSDAVPLKPFFYALRPAAAVAWLRERPEARLPPMDLPTLVAGIDLTPGAADAIDDLVARKAETRELGSGLVPAELRTFVDDQLAAGEHAFAPDDVDDLAQRRAVAAEAFRAMVRVHGPRRA